MNNELNLTARQELRIELTLRILLKDLDTAFDKKDDAEFKQIYSKIYSYLNCLEDLFFIDLDTKLELLNKYIK